MGVDISTTGLSPSLVPLSSGFVYITSLICQVLGDLTLRPQHDLHDSPSSSHQPVVKLTSNSVHQFKQII